MQLVLYYCKAERERIDKTNFLGNPLQMNGTLRSPSSVIDPEITIEKSNLAYNGYNYMYIPDFKRFYFITNVTSVNNKLWKINAHVDVLMSWRNDIRGSKVIIDKSQVMALSNMYLDDGSFVMDTRKYTHVQQFPNGLDVDGRYVLICAGGDGS